MTFIIVITQKHAANIFFEGLFTACLQFSDRNLTDMDGQANQYRVQHVSNPAHDEGQDMFSIGVISQNSVNQHISSANNRRSSSSRAFFWKF